MVSKKRRDFQQVFVSNKRSVGVDSSAREQFVTTIERCCILSMRCLLVAGYIKNAGTYHTPQNT